MSLPGRPCVCYSLCIMVIASEQDLKHEFQRHLAYESRNLDCEHDAK